MADELVMTPADLGTPLSGRSVLVTRTRQQALSLVEPLEELGAEVLTMPVLEIIDPEDWGPVDAAIETIGAYDWIVFTSTNGVDRFLHRFREVHGSYDDLASTCVAAVGSATAHHLRAEGFPPAIVPDDFRAEGLVAAFEDLDTDRSLQVLIPRAQEAREVFPDALRAMGCSVDVVATYQTVAAAPDPVVIARLLSRTIDVGTFTSGAIARAFLDAVSSAGLDTRDVMSGMTVASIGPITSEALRGLGFEPEVEATESTMGALVGAVVAYFANDAAIEASPA